MALPVALQLYSVRDEIKADMRGTLEKVKEMGYDGVEFAGLFNHSPEEIRTMCEEIGLIPISAHVPYLDMMGAPYCVIGKYKEIGCKYVAVPSLSGDYRPDGKGFSEVLKNIEMLGKVAKEFGLQMLYHNHDFEFVKIDGKYGLDVIYDTIPADYLKTEIDTCWVNVGGEVPAEYVRKYAGRCPIVHLKDFVGNKSNNMYELIGVKKEAVAAPAGDFEFRPVGSGKNDFPAILKAAEESGAEWVVVEQDKATMGLTPLESAAKSREYLKTIGY